MRFRPRSERYVVSAVARQHRLYAERGADTSELSGEDEGLRMRCKTESATVSVYITVCGLASAFLMSPSDRTESQVHRWP